MSKSCESCGAEVPTDALDPDLCPPCLLRLGLGEDPPEGGAEVSAPAGPGSDAQELDLQIIGPYRLLEVLGEGGMGMVYLAEQRQPVRRRVALKVIKLGMDSKEILGRFESERQALALMNHPAIAGVLEAGRTERGRAYFAMEFVKGVPITEYCDTYRLDIRQRLRLFTQVCDGVQHAHQKGIIHRDIKPSNVLVKLENGKPVPKIIDFGLAKATAYRLTERTLHTHLGLWIGTPEYMSPEQAEISGLDIDTRTDVYSLGVLLYELLAGARPFDSQELRSLGLDDLRRKIREVEPPTPSTRLSSLGDASTPACRDRRTDLPVLAWQLRGDLDWITMKALEKDRTRRYGSPAELVADLRRHLGHQPVQAGPPGTLYRMGKFVRRHRLGFVASVALAGSLLLGAVGTTVGLVRARQAERAAREEAVSAEQVADFLVELFEVLDPEEAREGTVTAMDLLAAGKRRVQTELQDQPLLQARLMDTIGKLYTKLGLYEQAEPLLQEALDLREGLLGEKHLDVASTLHRLGILYQVTAKFPEAEKHLQRAIEIRQAVGGVESDLAASIGSLAGVYFFQGDLVKAEELSRRALLIKESLFGPDHLEVAKAVNNLGAVLAEMGREAEAEELLVRSLSVTRKALGDHHPKVASKLANLGVQFLRQGKLTQAEQHLQEALEVYDRVLGPDHPNTARVLGNLGDVYRSQKHFDESEQAYREALAIQEKALGPDHHEVAGLTMGLARLRSEEQRLDEAAELFQRTLLIREASLGSEHPLTREVLKEYADLLRRLGREREAEELEARFGAQTAGAELVSHGR